MDISKLKLEINRYLDAMKKEGYNFQFVALIPAYPGITDTSYILQVKASWITNSFIAFDYMTPKLFEILNQPTRAMINRIDIYNEDGELFCQTEDLILINDINYKPSLHRVEI